MALDLSRRQALLGLIAAPAIVRASSLMPIKQMFGIDLAAAADTAVVATYSRNTLLTINQITREAVRLFANSNEFIKKLDKQYEERYLLNPNFPPMSIPLKIRLPTH